MSAREPLWRSEAERLGYTGPIDLELVVDDAPTSSGRPEPVRLLDAPPAPTTTPLIEGLLPAAEPSLIVGEGGVGKSTVVLAIGGAVAGGYPAFGAFAVPAGGPVLIVSEEDAQAIIQAKLEALIVGAGWDRARVLGNTHLLALEGVRVDDLAWQLHLAKCAADRGAVLVIFDPLSDMLTGNENDPTAARAVVQFWRVLTRQGHAVLTCHHLSKPNERYAGQDRVRGASSWANAGRAVFTVASRDGGLTLTCEKFSRAARPGPIELTLTIDTDPANPSEWRSAKLEAIGQGRDWRATDRRALSPSDRSALEALDRHRGEALSYSAWQKVTGVSTAAFSRARSRLLDLGLADKQQAGTTRFKRPAFVYEITGPGLAALVSDPETTRLSPDYQPDYQNASEPETTRLSLPKGSDRSSGSRAGSPDSHLVGTGPGAEPLDSDAWDGLLTSMPEPTA